MISGWCMEGVSKVSGGYKQRVCLASVKQAQPMLYHSYTQLGEVLLSDANNFLHTRSGQVKSGLVNSGQFKSIQNFCGIHIFEKLCE